MAAWAVAAAPRAAAVAGAGEGHRAPASTAARAAASPAAAAVAATAGGTGASGNHGGAGGTGTGGPGGGAGGVAGGSGSAGTAGGGGGGGGGNNAASNSGAGGLDTSFGGGYGVGGGGGGGGGSLGSNIARPGANGGTYGGGGGGAGTGNGAALAAGGTGGQGLLVITYTPRVLATIAGDIPVTAAIAAELTPLSGGNPHGVLRRGRRGRNWQNVPEELKPVVALAEEWSEADPVARAVEEALAKHARITLRTSAARRARLIDEAKRAVIAAVERAAEMDDEEALIALL